MAQQKKRVRRIRPKREILEKKIESNRLKAEDAQTKLNDQLRKERIRIGQERQAQLEQDKKIRDRIRIEEEEKKNIEQPLTTRPGRIYLGEKHLHLRSNDGLLLQTRDDGEKYTTNVRFTLPPNFFEDVHDGKLFVRIENFAVPHSFYSINQFVNKISITEMHEDLTNVQTKVEVAIPKGNYDVDSVIAELESSLEAASPLGLDYTVTYDERLNKVTIGMATADRRVNIDLSPDDSIAPIIGFHHFDETIYFITGTNGDTITSEKQVRVFTIESILIRSSLLSNNVHSTSSQTNSILARIPIDATPLSYEHYSSQSQIEISPNYRRSIDIKITDSFSNILDLELLNWEMSLVFTYTE